MRAVVVISAGFGEAGEEGVGRQDAVLRTAREYGMRLVGPNCLGVLNIDPAVRLDATFGVMPHDAGGFAVLAQSGAFAAAVAAAADRPGSDRPPGVDGQQGRLAATTAARLGRGSRRPRDRPLPRVDR